MLISEEHKETVVKCPAVRENEISALPVSHGYGINQIRSDVFLLFLQQYGVPGFVMDYRRGIKSQHRGNISNDIGKLPQE